MLPKERILGLLPGPFGNKKSTVREIVTPGIEPTQNLSRCYALVSDASAGPSYQNVPFPLRHFCLAGYNEDGNVNLRVLQYSGKFHFYTFLEFMIIFVGLPNIFGGVTVEGLSASHSVTSPVPTAGCDLSMPRL
jgi:hypothetical protein